MSADTSPHDLAAERALIAAVLLDARQFDVANRAGLRAEMFYRGAHVALWRACGTLAGRGIEPDPLTLQHELGDKAFADAGGARYLGELTDGASRAGNVPYFAGVVADCARRRSMLQRLAKAAEAIHREGVTGDVAQALAGLSFEAQAAESTLGQRGRTLTLTSASTIPIAAVRYLWAGRMAAGTFGLLGGREGVGKTAFSAWLTAGVTTGTLDGALRGRPSDVLVLAGEDSWSHTIKPRLLAVGADLDRVHRVDVHTGNGTADSVSLPLDTDALRLAIIQKQAALVILDPLLSRLDGALDSHKDADVRRALEPLAGIAHDTGACICGLLHVNKSTSTDPLNMLMASRAFAAVARWVLFAATDPSDDGRRLLGLAKNNLGPTDLPTLAYRVEGCHVADTKDGPVWTGRLAWLGEASVGIREAVQDASVPHDRTAVGEAADWLADYLREAGGSAPSSDAKRDGGKEGHSHDALKRALRRLQGTVISTGMPRRTVWHLPASLQSAVARGGSPPIAPTAPTGDFINRTTTTQSEQSEQSGETPREMLRLDEGGHRVRIS